MAFDFNKLLTPEQEKKREYYAKWKNDRVQEHADMDARELRKSAEYCLSQMQGPRNWPPGAPVYDATLSM